MTDAYWSRLDLDSLAPPMPRRARLADGPWVVVVVWNLVVRCIVGGSGDDTLHVCNFDKVSCDDLSKVTTDMIEGLPLRAAREGTALAANRLLARIIVESSTQVLLVHVDS